MEFLVSSKLEYSKIMEHADVRTQNYTLVWNTPLYVVTLTTIYLMFVWKVPHFMKHYQPLDVRSYMIVYNLGQVLLSVYMTCEIFFASRDAGYNYVCDPYNETTHTSPKEMRIANAMWVYFISKAVDFLDTVFMVLRKKNDQVTFLHVFHHVCMLNSMWCIVTFSPGGQPVLGALLNSFIHTIMYSYYGLSLFPALKKFLWWKRYLTKLQLTQFFILLMHSTYSLYSACDYPKWAQYLVIAQLSSYIVLFINFFIHAYTKKRVDDPNGNVKESIGNGHLKES